MGLGVGEERVELLAGAAQCAPLREEDPDRIKHEIARMQEAFGPCSFIFEMNSRKTRVRFSAFHRASGSRAGRVCTVHFTSCWRWSLRSMPGRQRRYGHGLRPGRRRRRQRVETAHACRNRSGDFVDHLSMPRDQRVITRADALRRHRAARENGIGAGGVHAPHGIDYGLRTRPRFEALHIYLHAIHCGRRRIRRAVHIDRT